MLHSFEKNKWANQTKLVVMTFFFFLSFFSNHTIYFTNNFLYSFILLLKVYLKTKFLLSYFFLFPSLHLSVMLLQSQPSCRCHPPPPSYLPIYEWVNLLVNHQSNSPCQYSVMFLNKTDKPKIPPYSYLSITFSSISTPAHSNLNPYCPLHYLLTVMSRIFGFVPLLSSNLFKYLHLSLGLFIIPFRLPTISISYCTSYTVQICCDGCNFRFSESFSS